MKNLRLLPFFIFLLTEISFAQSDTLKVKNVNQLSSLKMVTGKGIMFGAHLANFPMFEIGYGFYSGLPENSKIPASSGYAVSVENYLGSDYIMAPKLSFWSNVLTLNCGGSLPWYTDLKGNNCLKIRPELGIGNLNWRVNIAYNFPIYNHNLKSVSDFMVSVNYIVPVKKGLK